MTLPIKLFADFNNSDQAGRIRLNTKGSLDDIKKKNIQLKPGLKVLLDDNDELSTVGVIEFSHTENIWVASIDWDDLQ